MQILRAARVLLAGVAWLTVASGVAAEQPPGAGKDSGTERQAVESDKTDKTNQKFFDTLSAAKPAQHFFVTVSLKPAKVELPVELWLLLGLIPALQIAHLALAFFPRRPSGTSIKGTPPTDVAGRRIEEKMVDAKGDSKPDLQATAAPSLVHTAAVATAAPEPVKKAELPPLNPVATESFPLPPAPVAVHAPGIDQILFAEFGDLFVPPIDVIPFATGEISASPPTFGTALAALLKQAYDDSRQLLPRDQEQIESWNARLAVQRVHLIWPAVGTPLDADRQDYETPNKTVRRVGEVLMPGIATLGEDGAQIVLLKARVKPEG